MTKNLSIPLKRIGDGETVSASYEPHEERATLAHIEAAEQANVPRAVLEHELEFVHALKSEFDAVLREDVEPLPDDEPEEAAA